MSKVYYRTSLLESIGRKVLSEYDRSYLNGEVKSIPIEKIAEQKYKLSIDFIQLTNNGRILGKTVFDDGCTSYYDVDNQQYELLPVKRGTVLIDASLLDEKNNGRLRFTVAHEVAHWILHNNIYTGTYANPALLTQSDDTCEEWQANKLATYILMPKGQVKRAFFNTRTQMHTTQQAVAYLAKVFEVSKEAMKIRLQELKLI